MVASIGDGARRGTYSIVARDRGSGELGVAVQSHWFGVGAVVAWARPGVGAVATQSVAEVAHGPNALDALARGLSAAEAIAEVLRADELAPEADELTFWAGLGVAAENLDAGVALVRRGRAGAAAAGLTGQASSWCSSASSAASIE
jgi:hypothetical protein